MSGYRDSRLNRDRRADSFARAVIAEAERRRLLEQDASHQDDDMWKLGDCPHCGNAYHDERERQYHADAECVGGTERFR